LATLFLSALLVATLTALSGCAHVAAGTSGGLALAQGGVTAYRIVVSAKADTSTRAVAEDMAAILAEITGAAFPVVTDIEEPSANEIVVGHDNSRLAGLQLAGMTETFATDEYEIRTVGQRLVIAGGPPRGSINGMYGFLQDHLGCRWFTPAASRIPKDPDLTIGRILDRQKSAFLWREISSPSYWDTTWAARNRYHTNGAGHSSGMVADMDPRLYSSRGSCGGHGLTYVPESLFAEHPEYYAEIDGKRELNKDINQRAYCVTNPGFVKWAAEWCKDKLRGAAKGRSGYPPATDLGIVDNWLYCQCASCKASFERIGKGDLQVGLAGTYHEFYNRVAEEIAKDIPEFTLDFIAYHFTGVPSGIKLHPKIQVTWCPMGACQAHSFDGCDANRDINWLGALDQWLEQTKNLRIWYYHYQSAAWMPHMNLFATQPNFKAFQRRGVTGIMQQGIDFYQRTHAAFDGDKQGNAINAKYCYLTTPQNLGHLNTYISVQLAWNPDYDVKKGITEFCQGYYGAAAREMEQIVYLLESVSSYERTMGTTFSSYAGVHQSMSMPPMLKWSAVEKMDSLFDLAEKQVAGSRELLRRVQMLRLTHQQNVLCYAPADSPLRQKAFAGFFPLIEELGVWSFGGTGISGPATPAEFRALVSDPSKIVIPGQEKVGENLLRNTGFEVSTYGYGVPDDWSGEGSYMPENYTLNPNGIIVDATKAYTGKYSVRMTKKPSAGKTVCLRQRFDAKPGSRYRMSLRYQAEVQTGGFYVIFTGLDKDGQFLRHYAGNRGVKNTGGEWALLQTDTGIENDTAFLLVEVLFYDDTSAGVAWVDDFSCAPIKD
jgi:hypothetical protein